MSVRFLPAGERGLTVELGDEVSIEINNQVRAMAGSLENARIPGIVEVVPTYRSLGIEYDPLTLSFHALQGRVSDVLAGSDASRLPPSKLVRLPTVYGGEYGPDLPFVAEHARLSEIEVIRLHSQTIYHVYMLGFAAGFAYLGGLPERLHTPRLDSPRLRVPKGSVGIGGSQTGAYPAETPGGWRIIGRTYAKLFDPSQEVPTPMGPGDQVQFVSVSEADYRSAEPRAPSPEPSELRAAGLEPRTESGEMAPSTHPRGSRLAAPGSLEALEVLRPGLLTTVQDRGRLGYQKFGVPVSGAVDEVALRVANTLVGNPQDAAALEITASGPQLRMLHDVVLALTGAEFEADLDGEPVSWYQSFGARRGQILDIREHRRGFRAYLAVGGGIAVPQVLQSRSTCLVAGFGGFRGRALAAGDVLPTGRPTASLESLEDRRSPDDWRRLHGSPGRIRVVLGPQDAAFTEEGRRTFLESAYRVTPHVDRMGCRLEGPRIAHRDSPDIISDWVPLGGIQVPGDGMPIVLLADRQTTGGYAKIATVIRPDLGLLAQRKPGDTLRFHAVSMEEAQEIFRELEWALATLPQRLVGVANWGYAAEVGEIPGDIPDFARDLPAVGPDP